MNQEKVIDEITNHIRNGECDLCIKMGWSINCPWNTIPDELTCDEEDEYVNEHIEELIQGCKTYLGNKLSTHISIRNNKIETTEDGTKFITEFFTHLDKFNSINE